MRFATLAVVLGVSLRAPGATIIVGLEGSGTFTAIQPALDAARDGDTVLVKTGEYVISEPLDFNRLHDPGDPLSPPAKDLVLRSEDGAGLTTIRVESRFPRSGVVFRSGETRATRLEGFTLTGGGGHPTASGYFGGGIYCRGSSPTLRAMSIVRNSAEMGGGVYIEGECSPLFVDCEIASNRTVELTELPGLQRSGGGVYSLGSSPVFEASAIVDNIAGLEAPPMVWTYQAWTYGGGLCGSASLVRCTIARNLAARGGGIAGGRLTIDSSTISENRAWWAAGGIAAYEGSSISRSTISGNAVLLPVAEDRLGTGGGVVSGGSSTIYRCLISGNSGQSQGGGVACEGAGLVLDSCTILGNLARAKNMAGAGGGVHLLAPALLTNCLIEGNLATVAGGGVWIDTTGVALVNCTVTGNSSIGVQLGPGAEATLRSSILWHNEDESVGGNGWTRVSYCFVDDDSFAHEVGNRNEDPLFVEEGAFDFTRVTVDRSFGGLFYHPDVVVDPGDYSLRPGSPAINQGSPEEATAVDIEGTARPCEGWVDPGAYEYCPGLDPFERGDANADGALDISDAIATFGFLFLGSTPPSCRKAADTNDDGTVDISDPISTLNFLFYGASSIPPPRGHCGRDETPDAISCESFPPCSG